MYDECYIENEHKHSEMIFLLEKSNVYGT